MAIAWLEIHGKTPTFGAENKDCVVWSPLMDYSYCYNFNALSVRG